MFHKTLDFLTLKRAVLIFALFNLADMLTTTIGVLFLHLNEGNPLLVGSDGNFLWVRMFLIKALVTASVATGLYVLLKIRHRRTMYYVAVLAVFAIMTLVIVSNLVSILTVIAHA